MTEIARDPKNTKKTTGFVGAGTKKSQRLGTFYNKSCSNFVVFFVCAMKFF